MKTALLFNIQNFIQKISNKDLWRIKRNWWRANSRFLHCCSFFKRFFILLFIVALPVIIVFSATALFGALKIDRNDGFFEIANDVWATCSAAFGFFLSVFLIALTKEKTYFGVSFRDLYLKVLWRTNCVEYYLLYWEICYFFYAFVSLIYQVKFELFWISILLGALSLISFFLVYKRLRSSDQKNWLRNMRELHDFGKVPFYLFQEFSFVNFYQGAFPIRKKSLSRFGNTGETLKFCVNYLSKQLDRHESIFPDFDIFLHSLEAAPQYINSDFDFINLNSAFIRPAFALVRKLRENHQKTAALELESALCQFVLSLSDAPILREARKVDVSSSFSHTSLSRREEIKVAVFFLEIRFLEAAFLGYLKAAKESLFLGDGLPNSDLMKKLDSQILIADVRQAQSTHFLTAAKDDLDVVVKVEEQIDSIL